VIDIDSLPQSDYSNKRIDDHKDSMLVESQREFREYLIPAALDQPSNHTSARINDIPEITEIDDYSSDRVSFHVKLSRF